MINEILQQVQQQKGMEFAEQTNITESQIPIALEVISSTVMKKAKSYIDDGKVLELKELFLDGDSEEKQNFMDNLKQNIGEKLNSELGIELQSGLQLTELAVPEIIKVSKEKLLGPDGKVSFTDFPRLLSFFKSEGKEVKEGGLGSLFGF